MTKYLQRSFTVYAGKPQRKEKCSVCGISIPVVTRKRNGKPECQECFTKPKM